MRIGIVTPAPPGSRYGNRVTALRWVRILKGLGHSISIRQQYSGERWDLLIALHARRSHASIKLFRRDHPKAPIIVALTGTDLYRDLHRSRRAQQSLDVATRIVVLQPKALEELPPRWRNKARVVYQSVQPSSRKKRSPSPGSTFNVCVIGHLRPVKDPFRAALAARRLPDSSRIRVMQVGGAMTRQAATRARAEMNTNRRYRWIGEVRPERARQLLGRSDLFVLSSRMEGGANALGEAIVEGVPVIASRIPGSVGILGDDYAGYYEPGNTRELAELMSRAEMDPSFRARLREACKRLATLFDPARERRDWRTMLIELVERDAP